MSSDGLTGEQRASIDRINDAARRQGYEWGHLGGGEFGWVKIRRPGTVIHFARRYDAPMTACGKRDLRAAVSVETGEVTCGLCQRTISYRRAVGAS